MDQYHLTRRRFIISLIALSGATGPLLRPELFAVSQAWAESPVALDPSVRKAMVRMARLLFPHDALPDGTYADVLDQALGDAAASDGLAKHLDAAAAALDAQSGDSWNSMSETEQVAAMRRIEAEPYFSAIQERIRLGVYNSPAFWKHVDYPGPSKDFGGYLHRGAGDIDWLPEDE